MVQTGHRRISVAGVLFRVWLVLFPSRSSASARSCAFRAPRHCQQAPHGVCKLVHARDWDVQWGAVLRRVARGGKRGQRRTRSEPGCEGPGRERRRRRRIEH
eukprot:705296-Rhodomonas_salina.1